MRPCTTAVFRFWFHFLVACVLSSSANATGGAVFQDDSPQSFEPGPNTQPETVPPLTDPAAVEAWVTPPGFEIGLFSSSPKIAQPIAGTFDRMGRLWLAENYTYAELPQRFDRSLRDRVVILQDSNQDGVADRHSVFYDQAEMLASVEVGMGGVWLLCAPRLLFIPDQDLDGRPDGEPQVILDGFEDREVGHNLVNGLRWGPDGWLYGRHGIQATSHVGKPGTPPENRITLNCCIWRYHPVYEKFEVVTHGTTNPWGHDWDEHGELFFINTVIGHLWHAIPGLHTERMYGEDLRPYLFHLTAQVADHYHWDRQFEAWMQQRDGMTPGTDAAGGGHAHSGLAIYHGYRWPSEYHGDVLTLNFHGRRINQDKLKSLGATYTAEHCPDPFKTSDPWFRGIDLFCGPDDAMYVLDWSDLGECHENDGIHRSSGRIYRVNYSTNATTTSPANVRDVTEVVATLNSSNLLGIAELLHDQRPWVWRQARLRLQEHASGFGREDAELEADLFRVKNRLQAEFSQASSSGLRHRLLTGLWATGLLKVDEIATLLGHSDPHVRVWAIRFLTDSSVAGPQQRLAGLELGTMSSESVAALLKLAASEQHGLVLTYLASSMRLMNLADRWIMASYLVQHGEFAEDRVFPYLLWYGLEPSIAFHSRQVAEILNASRLPVIDRFVARRLAIEYTFRPDALQGLLGYLGDKAVNIVKKNQILDGLTDGWKGWSDLPRPTGWEVMAHLSEREKTTAALVEELNTYFENRQSLSERLVLLGDEKQTLELRGSLIRSVVRDLERVGDTWSATDEQAAVLLGNLLGHRFLSVGAAQGLARWRDSRAADILIRNYPSAPAAGQVAIISALCERSDRARALLSAIQAGAIPKAAVSANQIRQLQLLGQEEIGTLVAQIWPELTSLLGKSQMQLVQSLREVLSPEAIAKADIGRGQKLFQQQCGKCHRLFGAGETLGPELTGAQRDNLSYWLQNIVAPSAEVNTEFRLSLIQMADGRTLSGVVTQKSPSSFVLVSQEQSQLIKQEDVEEIKPLSQSLMPDGLLDSLTDSDKQDLFKYLMSPAGK
ncbi:MAG: c-type cytochrome [Planctomycetaceae bacterium]|nr:c-type cytochrome [Planctomycetaceae bacterium]